MFLMQQTLLPQNAGVYHSVPGTQHHHNSAKDLYGIEFYYEVIDLMISGIDKHFDSQACSLLKYFSVLHPKRLFDIDCMTKLSGLSQFYAEDIDGTSVKMEFDVFQGHKDVNLFSMSTE